MSKMKATETLRMTCSGNVCKIFTVSYEVGNLDECIIKERWNGCDRRRHERERIIIRGWKKN